MEGTGSYGAVLARHLRYRGISVVEVDRLNRQVRNRQGKSDHVDAIAAARAALSGTASGELAGCSVVAIDCFDGVGNSRRSWAADNPDVRTCSRWRRSSVRLDQALGAATGGSTYHRRSAPSHALLS